VIYRIVPAALLVALFAALGSTARGATNATCVDQTITRMSAPTVVGTGKFCATASALTLNARVTLPKGAWTIYVKSLWNVARRPATISALHTHHVQGGTTVSLYDRVVLPAGVEKSQPMSATAVVVKGAKGCTVMPYTITGAALAPNCPKWAATTAGTIVIPR
jgi:hypothetical protein